MGDKAARTGIHRARGRVPVPPSRTCHPRSSSAVTRWRTGGRAELWWQSAHSLRRNEAKPYPGFVLSIGPAISETPGWYGAMNFLRPRLLADIWQYSAAARWWRPRWTARGFRLIAPDGWGGFAAALAGIATLSVTISWLAFRFYNLPLPLGRTGIFLIPLCTLVAGAIGAAPDAIRCHSRWLRCGITAVLICMACYFLLLPAADLFQGI